MHVPHVKLCTRLPGVALRPELQILKPKHIALLDDCRAPAPTRLAANLQPRLKLQLAGAHLHLHLWH